MRIFLLITLLLFFFVEAASQESSQTRAQEIAVSFNKTKLEVKEKNGVRREKYKEIRSESTAKQNIADYAGRYEVAELGYAIKIEVTSDGRIQASGSDNGRSFHFENARIEGALLTATKVFREGTREEFEGVFMTRTERNSPTEIGVTTFGLGVVLRATVELKGNTYDKMFYQRK